MPGQFVKSDSSTSLHLVHRSRDQRMSVDANDTPCSQMLKTDEGRERNGQVSSDYFLIYHPHTHTILSIFLSA